MTPNDKEEKGEKESGKRHQGRKEPDVDDVILSPQSSSPASDKRQGRQLSHLSFRSVKQLTTQRQGERIDLPANVSRDKKKDGRSRSVCERVCVILTMIVRRISDTLSRRMSDGSSQESKHKAFVHTYTNSCSVSLIFREKRVEYDFAR